MLRNRPYIVQRAGKSRRAVRLPVPVGKDVLQAQEQVFQLPDAAPHPCHGQPDNQSGKEHDQGRAQHPASGAGGGCLSAASAGQEIHCRTQQAREQVCQRKGHQHAQQVSEKQPQGEHAGSDAQGTRRRPFPVEAAGFCPALLRLVCHGVPLFLFPHAFYALYG